jgi:hypothetical protein
MTADFIRSGAFPAWPAPTKGRRRDIAVFILRRDPDRTLAHIRHACPDVTFLLRQMFLLESESVQCPRPQAQDRRVLANDP